MGPDGKRIRPGIDSATVDELAEYNKMLSAQRKQREVLVPLLKTFTKFLRSSLEIRFSFFVFVPLFLDSCNFGTDRCSGELHTDFKSSPSQNEQAWHFIN